MTPPPITLANSPGFGSRHPFLQPRPTPALRCFNVLLDHTSSPFVVDVDLRAPAVPAVNASGPHAMVFRSRSSRWAIGLHASNAWAIRTRSPPIPKPCFISPTILGGWASYRTGVSAPPLAPGVYTIRDLIKKPPQQQPEVDKVQRHHARGKKNTPLSPIEQTKSNISQTKSQYPIDEKYEVSCLANPPLCTQNPPDLVLETDPT